MILRALLFICIITASTRADPGISIHLAPVPDDPCAILDTEFLCADVTPSGDSSERQLAYLVVTGVSGIRSVQFGINYDPGVRVGSWIACLDGNELPLEKWPGPGSGMGLAWTGCLRTGRTDSVLVLGALEIDQGSWGRIWIERYGLERDASIEACRPDTTITLWEPHHFGVARVQGRGATCVTCLSSVGSTP